MTTTLLTPILAVEECSGIAVTIPAGETVEYESVDIALGVADLGWHGETYFANLEDVLEATWLGGSQAYGLSDWVN